MVILLIPKVKNFKLEYLFMAAISKVLKSSFLISIFSDWIPFGAFKSNAVYKALISPPELTFPETSAKFIKSKLVWVSYFLFYLLVLEIFAGIGILFSISSNDANPFCNTYWFDESIDFISID